MSRQYGALSGIAIFLIAVNHAIHFGLQVAPVDGVALRGLIILQALGAFAVPAFLFISGAFLAYAASEFSFTLIKANLERILWPYVLWSLVFFGVIFVLAGEQYSPAGYVKNLLVGYPYHFVPLLAFWYVTAPALVPVARRAATPLLAVIAVYQAGLLALRHPGVFGGWLVLPAWSGVVAPPVLFTPMSDWAIYFPLGLVLSLHAETVRPWLLRVRPAALALTAVIFGLGLLNALQIVWAPWARFVAPLPLMFVLPVIDRAAIPWLQRAELLGRRSYGIYLVHFVLLYGLSVFIQRAFGTVTGLWQVIVFPAFLVVALAGSQALMDTIGKSGTGRRVYRYWFGMPPPAPARRAASAPRPASVAL
jgi:surface polysaccharide O-acyltransferase-like enzyme